MGFNSGFKELRTNSAELQQCFSNIFVAGTIFQTETLRGTPSPYFISIYGSSKRKM